MAELVRAEAARGIQKPACHELILDVAELHHARGIPGVGGDQEAPELVGQQRKNRRNTGIPLLQQIREKSGGRVEAPLGDRVGQVKNVRLGNPGRDRVDVGRRHLFPAGIGRDLLDLGDQGFHLIPAEIDEPLGRFHLHALAVKGKAPGDPAKQHVLVLDGKTDLSRVGPQELYELALAVGFLSLVQPEGHRAVIRDVRQDFDQPVRFAQLVIVQVPDFDEAAFREKRQRIDGIAELRGIDLGILKHADLELLAPVRAADLPKSIEEAVPQVLLFSPEEVKPGRAFVFQFSDLGGVIERRFFFPFCHTPASPGFRPSLVERSDEMQCLYRSPPEAERDIFDIITP